jgi:pteridine reductase
MAQGWVLKGKTALVTGAARRVGRTIALALARAGVRVVVHHRRSGGEAEALLGELRALGVDAWTIAADLSSPEEAEGLFDRVVEMAGPVDILVNNASIFPKDTVNDLTARDLMLNVSLHAYAPLALSRRLAAQGRDAAVINMIDARALDYDREHASYHLSKRMLLALTSMLAVELAPDVRVNGVSPGLILPPEGLGYDYLERLAPTNPLNAYGSPDDLAAAVLFLLESRFITGQIIYVDGGRHLRGRMYE